MPTMTPRSPAQTTLSSVQQSLAVFARAFDAAKDAGLGLSLHGDHHYELRDAAGVALHVFTDRRELRFTDRCAHPNAGAFVLPHGWHVLDVVKAFVSAGGAQ